MGYVKGEAPGQGSLFPVSLDELVPEDHPVRVIEAFVGALELGDLGFERAEPSAMGRPSYDPADLLKLYLYGYMNRIRSSRRLERECRRNVELMWLLGRLAPDFKTVADFRRRNGAAFVSRCVTMRTKEQRGRSCWEASWWPSTARNSRRPVPRGGW